MARGGHGRRNPPLGGAGSAPWLAYVFLLFGPKQAWACLFGAWVYPSQSHGWSVVPIGKIGAWYLLIILSFDLTILVQPPQAPAPTSSVGAWPGRQ